MNDPLKKIIPQPEVKYDADGSVEWAFFECGCGFNIKGTTPILKFKYLPNDAERFKADHKTAYCKFFVEPDKEKYFTAKGRHTRKVLFALLRDNMFPRIFQDLKTIKENKLEVINFYSGGKPAYKYLDMLKRSITYGKMKELKAETCRSYLECPFSSVTVNLDLSF